MAKNLSKDDGYTEGDFVQSGIDHLAAAGYLIKANPKFYDSAGYLCHLGIELILKSFLLSITNVFPRTHDIKKLCNKLLARGILQDLNPHDNTISLIDAFYKLRYPQPKSPVEIGDDDWDAIESFISYLLETAPNEIDLAIKNIDQCHKNNRVLCRRER